RAGGGEEEPAVAMEMGAGDAPSPPPRYNAPRSALYAAKMSAMATGAASRGNPAASPAATDRPAASPAATGSGAASPAAMGTTVAAAAGMVSTETIPMAGVHVVAGPAETVTAAAACPTPPPATETAAPRTPVKPLPAPFPSPAVVVVAPSPVAPEKSSPTATEGPAALGSVTSQDMGSQSSLGPGIPPPRPPPAPDTLSYLDSVSLMSGTLESLSGPGFLDDVSSLGSDSEINGLAYRRTDKYGFLGGNQHAGMPGRWHRSGARAGDWLTHRGGKWDPGPFPSRGRQLPSVPRVRQPFPSALHSWSPAGSKWGGSQPRSPRGPWGSFLPSRPSPLLCLPAQHHAASQEYRPGGAMPGASSVPFSTSHPTDPTSALLPVYAWLTPSSRSPKPHDSHPSLYPSPTPGVKIVFRVGLVLLRNALGSVDKLRSCQGMYETMEKLRNLPAQSMQEDFLIYEVVNLPVTEALIERENTTQLKKWRETRGELQYKPSRRLHGSRAIHEERHRMNPSLTASASLLSLTGLKQRATRGGSAGGSFSPAHPMGSLAVSAAPPPAAAPGQVVSEGLHPVLPSPTGNNTPLGGPKKGGPKERKKEKERERLQKEREKQEKEREKQEKEREKREKERERLQKEQEKQERKEKEKLERKQQKERAKEEAKQKKERKVSMRRKEPKAPPRAEDGGQDGDPPAGSVLQDTYF
uniref:TBC1 domain family member 10B n=1 Tax=Chelydra serpentina TaxID=8475 RepID=A0A8C3T7K7_CHESE